MKKYTIEFSELIDYKPFKITAENPEEAMEDFLALMEDGQVGIKTVETAHYVVKDSKGKEVLAVG